MAAEPVPLGDEEITEHLAGLPGWERAGDAITRTFAHTYHECVHLAVYVAGKAREVGHHPDMDITWQRIRFTITTHDAGGKLTEADFSLAADIDSIAAKGGASGVLLDSDRSACRVTRVWVPRLPGKRRGIITSGAAREVSRGVHRAEGVEHGPRRGRRAPHGEPVVGAHPEPVRGPVAPHAVQFRRHPAGGEPPLAARLDDRRPYRRPCRLTRSRKPSPPGAAGMVAVQRPRRKVMPPSGVMVTLAP